MKISTVSFTGIAYRAHHPMWSFDPLSGEGAKRHGGRFNRPGCAALYLSLDPTTAWMEAQQGFPFKPQPMTLVAYEVNDAMVIDLNDEALLNHLGFSVQDLACAWEDIAFKKQEPATWRLVDQLKALNVAGALVRSFASGCSTQNQNLVLWHWPDASKSIKVIDDFFRLPKTRKSWNED